MALTWVILTTMVFSYGTATFLQGVGATQEPADTEFAPSLLMRLLKRKVYVAAMGFQALGTLTAFVSRRDLPLFLVQSAVGAGIVVTALLGVVVFRWKLPAAEIALIAAALVGVTLLVFAADPGPPKDTSTLFTVVVGASPLVLIAAAHLCGRLHGTQGAVVLGALAGCTFGTSAVASRPLVNAESISEFFTDPLLYIFGILTVVGQHILGMSLQRGATTAAGSSMNAAGALLATVVGVIVLGDQVRDGYILGAVSGFFLTLAATVALAWYAEMHPHTTPSETKTRSTTKDVPSRAEQHLP